MADVADLVDVVEPEELSLPPMAPTEQSFEAVYKVVYRPLAAFAARKLGQDDGNDVVQEALFGIWRRWPEVARSQPTPSYFYGAVHNQIRHAKRGLIREMAGLVEYFIRGDAPHATRSADELQERTEAMQVIERTIPAMSPRAREVWTLVREHDLPYQQVAESLGLDETTVRRHMMRACLFLRRALMKAGYSESVFGSLLAPPPRMPLLLPPGEAHHALEDAAESPAESAEEDAHD